MANDTPTQKKSPKKSRIWYWLLLLLLVIAGGVRFYQQREVTFTSKFVSVDTQETSKVPRLPLAPHINRLRARPTERMVSESRGINMRFRLLDKRTLRIDQLVIAVGDLHAGPWGGWIAPLAYASDLVVRDGVAVHGQEGHVNPAVWVELRNMEQVKFFEGWLFARDSAQTAWDHPRFDLTFLGADEVKSKRP